TQPTQTNQTSQQYPNNVQSQQFQQFQTASIFANNAKFPYLEKDNHGKSPKRLGKDAKGNTIVHPLVSLDEHVAVQRENKVRTLLLQALPEDHMPDFHHYDDARDIWMAVKARIDLKWQMNYALLEGLTDLRRRQDERMNNNNQQPADMNRRKIMARENKTVRSEKVYGIWLDFMMIWLVLIVKVQAYQYAVKTLESQKDWYHKTQIALEEKIRVAIFHAMRSISRIKSSSRHEVTIPNPVFRCSEFGGVTDWYQSSWL
ncbi:hypothetical protein Tco_0814972, partial [Tanacetum coccineum]